MNIFFGILVFVVGIAAANALGNEAGWTVLQANWWLTVAPLCVITGMASGFFITS